MLQATLADADAGQSLKLQVEIQPSGTAFTSLPGFESPFVSPGVASVTAAGLAPGGYRWQCRTVDAAGAASAWVAFGSGPADFTIAAAGNVPPSAPSALGQFKSDGTVAVPAGQTTNEVVVLLRASVSDPDAGWVKLQIEPANAAWSGIPTVESAWVSSGTTVTLALPGISAGNCRWRARAVDSSGAASAWTGFGGNPETAADFAVSGAEEPGDGSSSGSPSFGSATAAPGPGGSLGWFLAAAAALLSVRRRA